MSKLEDIRRMRALVEKKEATEDLTTAARSLSEILHSNVYMVDNGGEIIAFHCGDRGRLYQAERAGKVKSPVSTEVGLYLPARYRSSFGSVPLQ